MRVRDAGMMRRKEEGEEQTGTAVGAGVGDRSVSLPVGWMEAAHQRGQTHWRVVELAEQPPF